MGKTAERVNFSLKKLKVNSDFDVEIEYLNEIPDDETTRKRVYSFEEKKMRPHDDMLELLKKMKRMLAFHLGLTKLEAMVNSKDFNATKEQKKILKKEMDEVLDKINITGIFLSGEALEKVKITGSYDGIGTASKLFSLEGESQGFEEEAKTIVKALEQEAYEYIFELKRAQLELFGQGEGEGDSVQASS